MDKGILRQHGIDQGRGASFHFFTELYTKTVRLSGRIKIFSFWKYKYTNKGMMKKLVQHWKMLSNFLLEPFLIVSNVIIQFGQLHFKTCAK